MITINTTPAAKSSAQDGNWFVASSDNSGQTGFKYVVDIYKGGTQLIRTKVYPDPASGKLYFDAGPTVRNEFLYDWFEPAETGFIKQLNASGECAVTYDIRIGEDYSGITTTNLASSQATAYNWAPPLFRRRQITLSDKEDTWLTNRPMYAKVGSDESLFIGYYSTSNYTLYWESFNHSNAFEASGQSSVQTLTTGIAQLNIGIPAINDECGSAPSYSCKYYEVWINSGERFRVYLDCNPKYNCTPVHFLNRWGVFDTLRFDLASRLTSQIDRKGYGKPDYRFNGNEVTYSAATYHETRVNHSNKAEYNYRLTADAMTDDEYIWAEELIYSPQVYADIDGDVYPVTLTTSNYERSKYVNNRLRPLEIEFQLNQTRYSHLR